MRAIIRAIGAAGIAVAMLVGVGPTGPAAAVNSAAIASAKKLTLSGPSTATVGKKVKVKAYVPSKSGTIDWGDGNSEPVSSGGFGTMTLCLGSKSACEEAARRFTATHVYTAPGPYTVTLTSSQSSPRKATLTIEAHAA